MDDEFYGGHDYLSECRPITGKFIDEFIRGIESAQRRFLFLFQERKIDIKGFSTEQLEELITKEAVSLVQDSTSHDLCEVEIGTQDLKFVQLYTCTNMYQHFLKQLSGKSPNAISKSQVIELLVESGELPEKREIREALEDDSLFYNTPESAEAAEFLSVVGPYSAGEVFDLGLKMEAAWYVITAYQECQAIQHQNQKDIRAIKWNIRRGSALLASNGSTDEIVETSALYYLREPILQASEKRDKTSCRREFEAYKIFAAKDEFRYHIARSMGIVDEDSATVTINDNLEATCFETVYQSWSKKGQKGFDAVANKRLSEIAKKHNLAVSC